jgi:hypothetical protein
MFQAITRRLDRIRRALARPAAEPVRFPARLGATCWRRDRRPAAAGSALARPVLRRLWLGGMW